MLADVGLLFLRLIVGGIFAAHGYGKVFGGPGKELAVPETARKYLGEGFTAAVARGGPNQFQSSLKNMGFPRPLAFAWIGSSTEFFGGIMLALGLGTRLAALGLAVMMSVAAFRVHWKNGLIGPGSFELPLALLGACLALLGTGPGRISIEGGDPGNG